MGLGNISLFNMFQIKLVYNLMGVVSALNHDFLGTIRFVFICTRAYCGFLQQTFLLLKKHSGKSWSHI